MEKSIIKFELNIKNISEVEDKIHSYFNYYNFELSNQNTGKLVFFKKGTFLDAWKLNPLNWKSKIYMQVIGKKKLLIEYKSYSNQEINPVIFENLYYTFIRNLELFINRNKDFKEENSIVITSAKKIVLKTLSLTIAGSFIGLVIGTLLSELTDIKYLSFIGIIVGALFTRKKLNNQLMHRHEVAEKN